MIDLTTGTAPLVVSVGPFHAGHAPHELELMSDERTVSFRLTLEQLAVLHAALHDFLAGDC